ncbi:hypothetical protein EYF80_022393 [Liparis tanakae]|uniref:Uncharacterized protein n=1 Tax=Liparis tanakae TaxID=230148 RepID=A0A4Z2HNV3_9TELE|nr:hypothetical protein EYF80_022393 [Liparis tanakae]
MATFHRGHEIGPENGKQYIPHNRGTSTLPTAILTGPASRKVAHSDPITTSIRRCSFKCDVHCDKRQEGVTDLVERLAGYLVPDIWKGRKEHEDAAQRRIHASSGRRGPSVELME